MCGRYTAKKSAVDLADEFDAADTTGDDVRADYNVAPTKRVPVVRSSRPPDGDRPADWKSRELTVMRWGLVPFWAKDLTIGSRMFNARSESVTTTRAFRSAVKRRRCLVPADGWYEWQKKPDSKDKQPYYMTSVDGAELAFAGLWEIWGEGEDRVTSFTILTTDSVGPLQNIHHRMPLVLPAARWDAWLDREREDVADLLRPPSTELVDALELRPVGAKVGNVRNNGPELTERAEPEAVGLF